MRDRLRVSEAIWIRSAGDVGTARRRAREAARASRCGEPEAIALATTEVASNLVAHGGGGIVQIVSDADTLDLMALDEGAATPHQRGLGAGLETLRRHATELTIARAVSRFSLHARFGPPRSPDVAALLLPLAGYQVSGDGILFASSADGDGFAAVVSDVLGHGPAASADRDRLHAALAEVPLEDPRAVIEAATHSLRGQRGAAVRWLRARAGVLSTFSIGNVGAEVIVGGHARSLLTEHGIVGRAAPTPRISEVPFPEGARLVSFSDGLVSRVATNGRAQHPAMVALELARDHRRGRDDAAVLVVDA